MRVARYLINNALEAEDDEVPASLFELRFKEATDKAEAIATSANFNNLITVTIIVVGVMIGVDTDRLMACERFTLHERDGASPNCGDSLESVILGCGVSLVARKRMAKQKNASLAASRTIEVL